MFDAYSRRRLIGRLLHMIARRCDMRLINPSYHWYKSAFHNQLIQSFDPSIKEIHDRGFNMIELAKLVKHLPGDTAECGVYEGRGSYMMLTMLGKDAREHHIFDSFEGLSAPEAADEPSQANAYRWQENDLSIPLSVVQKNLESFSNVSYYKGWIPERFEEVADRQFAMVHIDVDLYQPTYDSIAFFYPRMVTGGMILCDDYGSTFCPGTRQAVDDYMQDKQEATVELTSGQCFILRQ